MANRSSRLNGKLNLGNAAQIGDNPSEDLSDLEAKKILKQSELFNLKEDQALKYSKVNRLDN